MGELVLISKFSFFLLTFYSQWHTVPRNGNCKSGTRNGVGYRRKVIFGGRGIDTQSGWMLWVNHGWDGFVSNQSFHLILFLLLFFGDGSFSSRRSGLQLYCRIHLSGVIFLFLSEGFTVT